MSTQGIAGVPDNIRLSNPFDLVVAGDEAYVTDASLNLIWQVNIPTGVFAPLATFPSTPNPVFPIVGGPNLEAVPTGIHYSHGQLLVTLLRGAPFPPGSSQVLSIDPQTGEQTPFMTGLKTAIDVVSTKESADTTYFVLQHASSGLFFGSAGHLLSVREQASPTVLADCLLRPTSMALDDRTGTLYVTEYAGRLLAIPVSNEDEKVGQ